MQVDVGHSRWVQQLAPHDPVPFLHQSEEVQSQFQRAKATAAISNNQKGDLQNKNVDMYPKVSPALKSIIVGPVTPRDPNDPLVSVVPSLLKKVLDFFSVSPSHSHFRYLTCLHIDHDTPIPSYFNDPYLLAHLACILYPQIDKDALMKIG